MLAEFTTLYPQIGFQLQICNSSEVQQLLRQQQAQLGFIEGPVLTSEFSVQYWQQDQLVLIGSPQFHAALATGAFKADIAQQLLAQRWIVRERGSGTRAVLENELTRHGWMPAQVLEWTEYKAIIWECWQPL